MAGSITETEILEALQAAIQLKDADGFSTTDLAESMNVGQGQAQAIVRRLSRAGQIRCVGKRSGVRCDGVTCRIPVYALSNTIPAERV